MRALGLSWPLRNATSITAAATGSNSDKRVCKERACLSMKTKIAIHRRQFMKATATLTAAGGILPSASKLYANSGAIRETKHFWFCLAPEGPYIDSQRDNKAFGFGDGK